MKNILRTIPSLIFLLVVLSSCGSSNPSGDAGSGLATDAQVFNAGTAISEEFPPSVDCDPTASTGVVHGTVRDPLRGFVIFGAGLLLTREGTAPQRTSTDEQGTYRFCNIEPGTYLVSAYALGFEAGDGPSAQEVEVKAGLFQTADLELILSGQEVPSNIGAVQGRVSDIASSTMLEGVTVEALNNVNTENGQVTGTVVKGTLNKVHGEFFLSLRIGTYPIRFSKEGFITKTVFFVPIASDKVTKMQPDPVELFPE